ncbi:hypothetical protein IWW55_007341 [Coemansia sp. RSA 2706]|nr:hypothetical protein LPJ70_003058 [Coemansia sp. RSA 2708]KAJ2285153.1 hypothetical protein IWW55_007341 [Coemansia sp. RSA 2706]KAJ2302442.1 hypothetical protein IWW52_006998 [Coemansia sp. RSA 2704]KAJ2309977.1 hypothetical protein IWW51_006697 [Coemansia sp. RSA 2702]KAJ2386210.1 hypothetical protein H4S02_003961 [Coemansia sp. RSA 2611]KAJ2708821.1 hypothetical protein H4R23_006933 [Coemansia sp. Cherry 401B]
MNKVIVAIATAASAASAYPIYGYYPGYQGSTQSSYHNSGAYDNGASTSVSPYGNSYNSWNNGFRATQGNYATPYGNAGSSSYNQWSNNAWSNSYGGYPWRYW